MTPEDPTPAGLTTPALESLLWRLKERRAELAIALALSIDPDLPVMASTMEPLAMVETAIQAIGAEIALEALRDGHPRQVALSLVDVGSAAPVVVAPESTP